MEPLKIKNYLLLPLGKWLMKQELPGRQSRSRNRFLDMIRGRLTEIENTRIELAKKFADKDEQGNPVEIEKDGQKQFELKDEGLQAFAKEWNEYALEESIFDVTAGNVADMMVVASIVISTNDSFLDTPEATEATWYDGWCSAFEDAKLDPDSVARQAAA